MCRGICSDRPHISALQAVRSGAFALDVVEQPAVPEAQEPAGPVHPNNAMTSQDSAALHDEDDLSDLFGGSWTLTW